MQRCADVDLEPPVFWGLQGGVHGWLPEAPVSQPSGRVHPRAHVLAVIASEDADYEIHKVVTVGGYVVDVVAEAFGTPAGVTALPGYETACCVPDLRCVGYRY